MSRIKSLLASLLLVLAFTSPVFAQDATEPAPMLEYVGTVLTVEVLPTNADTVIFPLALQQEALATELEGALAAFLELVYSLTFTPLTASFVLVATSILKKLLPESIGAAVIALVLQVIVWVALTVARHVGSEAPFLSVLQVLTTILGALAGLVGSSYLATRFYNGARAENVPLFGNTRAGKAAA